MATTSTNNTNHTATQYHTHALCEFSPWMDWSMAVEESPSCSANNRATKSHGHPWHSCYWAAPTLAIVPSLFQGQQRAPAKATHVPFGVASLARTTTWNAVVIIILSGSDNGLRTSGPCRKKACRQISIVDRETATSRYKVLSWQAFSSTFDRICWKFFLIENQLFSHFLNTILHYWTVELLKIFKNLN